jgi:glycosyltransferase involved in cell wall biosynthesis
MSSSLRIAIDARAASHPQPGGFKAYVEGLIGGLAGLETQHQFVLCVDRAGGLPRELPPNFETPIVPAGPKLVGAGFREQIVLPLGMARWGAHVAHFPCNTAPLVGAGRRVVTIHDLILLRPANGKAPGSHETLHRRLMNGYYRLFLIVAVRSAHAIITVSRFSADEIAARFPAQRDRIHVVPQAAGAAFHGVNRAAAAACVHEQFGLEPGYVLALGSADPRKNVAAAIRAYGLLAPGLRARHRLVIVQAHPWLRASLEQVCAEAGVLEGVVFVNHLPHADMPHLYAAAGAFVFPSLYEGFGLPTLEAMACSTPVIASNMASIPEVAGGAALLVDPADPRALAEALQAVLADGALAGRLREAGLRRAAQFSWENTARQTLAVYEKVAQDSIRTYT